MLGALVLALANAQEPSAAPLERPGRVVLLGERADIASVPELRLEGLVHLRIAREGEPDARGEDVLHLPLADRHAADDPRLVERVRAARAIELDPAPLRDWFALLFPSKRESELVRALREAHRQGCTIVGRGESAALLSAATVVDDAREVGEPVCDPHDLGQPFVVWGLGFQPWAVFDESARSRGSLQRLLESIERERLRLAVWIDTTSAVVIDARGGRMLARGTGAVIVLDPRGSRSSRGELRDVGLAVLHAGDTWSRRERRAELASAASIVRADAPAPVERTVEHALEAGTILAALAALGPSPPATLVLDDGRRSLRIELESALRGDGKESGSWDGLRATFLWPAQRR